MTLQNLLRQVTYETLQETLGEEKVVWFTLSKTIKIPAIVTKTRGKTSYKLIDFPADLCKDKIKED